jgi:hypothetical protein
MEGGSDDQLATRQVFFGALLVGIKVSERSAGSLTAAYFDDASCFTFSASFLASSAFFDRTC